MMRNKNEKESSWLLKFIIVLGLILLGLIIFAITKETYRKQQVQKEIDELKQEAAKIDKQNAELSDKISYFESKDYQEKVAKDKLNLQDPGENVVIVKPNSSIVPSTQEITQTNEKKLVVKTSNIQKWWDYFFKQ
jgi:cell division protein FtsB